MIAPAVVGVQQNGVITCIKHYIMSTPPGPMLSLSLPFCPKVFKRDFTSLHLLLLG